MRAIVLDTETTDADAPELIEVAYRYVELDPDGVRVHGVAEPFVQRYQPVKPISYGAMATHHIIEEDLIDMPPSSSFVLPDDVTYVIAHNADFDWKVVGSLPEVRRICTLAMARKLWPELDSHRLGALVYRFTRDRKRARDMLRNAHSAAADIKFDEWLLNGILREAGPFHTFEELWLFSEEARVPSVMPFGKHKGLPVDQVPADYVRWLMKQPDVDPYLMKAFQ